MYRSPNITKSIKISQLRWAGHVERLDKEEIIKRIMECRLEGGRRVGRPKLRWIDGVMEDVKRM